MTPTLLYVMIGLFFVGLIYTLIQTGVATSNDDAKSDMKSAITGVAVVNSVLILFLAGLGYYYINSTPTAAPAYFSLITHVALLLSVISISISSLHQLNTKGSS